MKDGIYKVEFKTQLGTGTGVVTKSGNKVLGGDSGMYYAGTFEQEHGDNFNIKIRIKHHSNVPGMFSTLGLDNATLVLTGTNGNITIVSGSVAEKPDIQFEAHLTFLE